MFGANKLLVHRSFQIVQGAGGGRKTGVLMGILSPPCGEATDFPTAHCFGFNHKVYFIHFTALVMVIRWTKVCS